MMMTKFLLWCSGLFFGAAIHAIFSVNEGYTDIIFTILAFLCFAFSNMNDKD